ncbi:hypothetical protein [Nocardia sp. BMG51109]|uniref:hypothetical protein n=1 Tax=Nocardia sp. BMG51109 TaxID=1056816 RepID=UPI000466EEEE|nr:hypothetical protein [Nocardia sp. BMG51109]
MGEVTVLAERIRDVLVERGFGTPVQRSNGEIHRYEELTGVAAPTEVAELWSVLGGVDVVGMLLEGADSAGQACAARAGESEASGVGVPYEELDGSTDGAVRMVWWDRAWCPLVSTADNAIAVDGHPGEKGHVGQVMYCNFEVFSDREAVWPSAAEFVGDVLAVVSAEPLVVVNGFGSMMTDDGRDLTVMMAALEIGRARRDGRRSRFSTVT